MSERVAPECGCTTDGKIVRGMCAMHYDRWVHATPKDQRPPAPRYARDFWDSVDKSGDCWIWTGPTNRGGYGLWKRGLAHRASLNSEEPCPDPALFACHHCDNPTCVNPGHLYWGTIQDNGRDIAERGGAHNKGKYAEVCKRGHLLAGENLRVVGVTKKRVCRECDNMRSRERRRRYRKELAS